MNILGIHAFSHDTGACLIRDGEICAVSQERIVRKKYGDGGFPHDAVYYVMEGLNVRDVNEIDLVVFDRFGPASVKEKTIHALRKTGYRNEAICIDHHDAHAASAFFVSPFERAAVLVADGFGTSDEEQGRNNGMNIVREVQSVYIGRDNAITLIRRTRTLPQYQFGIGMFYGFASVFLGFGEMGAGKLMALAAYGNGKKVFKHRFLQDFQGEILGKGDKDPADAANISYYGKELFNISKPRIEGNPVKKAHAEIAHCVQEETENAVLCAARNLYDITECDNLCYSGGVALNCLTNTRIIGETNFKNVFVQPAATDCGIPLGCALYGYHVAKNMPRKFIMKNAFLGRKYSEQEIVCALNETNNIRYLKPRNLFKNVAEHLSQGKVVGWFEGRSEFGPRALGHRSILADPRYPHIKDLLDKKIKKREWFRPYAPAVLEGFESSYFDLQCKSPFMLLAPKAREDKRREIPAVVHVDGTARVQTVFRKDTPGFYRLIKEFYKITGVPVLLNTSFNTSGEPIVESPRDALNCFLRTEMDYLVIENLLVSKQ